MIRRTSISLALSTIKLANNSNLFFSKQSQFISKLKSVPLHSHRLTHHIRYNFATLPKHNVLTMPALSPTMTEGKIMKWNVKEGDLVDEGDVICEVETDKASVGFEATEKGYIAKISNEEGQVSVGTPIAVLTKKKENVEQFKQFTFDGQSSKQQTQEEPKQKKQEEGEKPKQQTSQGNKAASFPKHGVLKLPAVSPTMTEGKIIEWKIKIGDSFDVGDSLFSIQSDKATVDYEATQKGYLAKIVGEQNVTIPVGEEVAVFAKKKDDVSKFDSYTKGASAGSSPSQQKAAQKQAEQPAQQEQPEIKQKAPSPSQSTSSKKIFASPLAKSIAQEKGIDLSEISGSGPEGRIIRQDVENYQPRQQSKTVSQQSEQQKTPEAAKSTSPKSKPSKKQILQNPYEQIPLNGMRKTIAARLTESKTTIPHYYVQVSVDMGKVMEIRKQLNQNEEGVKISVNDMIVKATALALRDIPDVNSQWAGNVIKKFKHSDVSVAVATDGGLITPIVFRAETLGLMEIARKTKDIAKRAREGKLEPNEFIGGTTTVSNLGMFGISSVTSVINPPQSTILGVGATEKKIVFDPESTDPSKPYKVVDSMELIVSADHRVVDGALASRWLTKVKKYLEDPVQMLL